MNATDELERLAKFHKEGLLTNGEFAQVKSQLLNQVEKQSPSANDNSLSRVANRRVMNQMRVLFLIITAPSHFPDFR